MYGRNKTAYFRVPILTQNIKSVLRGSRSVLDSPDRKLVQLQS